MSSAQTMKIYSIISRIEQVLNDSPKYKLGGGNKKIVEVEELFDLLGDLKVTIPEDIRRASGIIAEETNILGDANEQAGHRRPALVADMHFLLHTRMLSTLHSVIGRLCEDSRRSPEKRIILKFSFSK